MESQLAKKIGQVARADRVSLGLTQAEAAERIGISNEFYARIERGKTMPSVPTLSKMADALTITVDAMFGRVGLSKAALEPKKLASGASRAKADQDTPELRRAIRRLRNAHPKTVHLVALLTAALDKGATSRQRARNRERGRVR